MAKKAVEQTTEVETVSKGLPKSVSDKYELIDIQPLLYFIPGHGEIDFSTITITQADRLFSEGCQYLKLKE